MVMEPTGPKSDRISKAKHPQYFIQHKPQKKTVNNKYLWQTMQQNAKNIKTASTSLLPDFCTFLVQSCPTGAVIPQLAVPPEYSHL